MPKFSGPAATTQTFAPVVTTEDRMLTHEGGVGWGRNAKSELFLLAVTNMVGEETFYETAGGRDDRFRSLIAEVTKEDPEWVARFVPYLRDSMQMRSASVVMAAEYVQAGGPGGRAVVASACSRADEPAELLGYWSARYGRRFPQPLKRGVADAVRRLYTERAALRYDGQTRGWRMGDVIEMVHPRPTAEWQASLFRWLLDRRHHGDAKAGEALPMLAAAERLETLPADERRGVLRQEGAAALAAAGFSWERLSGWLPGGMDAEAWEAVIPTMGYMALLRNLRNFDQAGVGGETAAYVSAKLADPDEVARSRQFPLRFLSAWDNTTSMRWGQALSSAVEHATGNVPRLPGRTLIMIDVSGSMGGALSGRSTVARWKAAAVFGLAVALRADAADTYIYDTNAWKVDMPRGASVLRVMDEIGQHVGGGTNTFGVLQALYDGHDRVLILTDEQAADAGSALPQIPLVFTFNLAGYRPGHLPSGQGGRYTFGGLTDAGFSMIPLLERHRSTDWPF